MVKKTVLITGGNQRNRIRVALVNTILTSHAENRLLL